MHPGRPLRGGGTFFVASSRRDIRANSVESARASPANWSRELWLAAEPATIQLLAAVNCEWESGLQCHFASELSTTPTSSDSIADDTPAHGPGGGGRFRPSPT